MASVRVVVNSPVGLHARPAASFVQAVLESGLGVRLGRIDGSDSVDARSILAVLSLDIAHGEEVEISADGDQAAVVLARLAELLRD